MLKNCLLCLICQLSLGAAAQCQEENLATAKSVLLLRSENNAAIKCGKVRYSYRAADKDGNIILDGLFETRFTREKLAISVLSLSEVVVGHSGLKVSKPQLKTFDGELFYQSDLEEAVTVGVTRTKNFAKFEDLPSLLNLNPKSLLPAEKALLDPSGDYKVQSAEIKSGVCEISVVGAGKYVQRFDMKKGACVFELDRFDLNGNLFTRETRSIVDSNAGFWFPSEIVQTGFLPDGSKLGSTEIKVDIANSRFNNMDDVPDNSFVIAVSPRMEVIDYRAGNPVVSYVGATGVLEEEQLAVKQQELIRRVKVTPGNSTSWLFAVCIGFGLVLALGLLICQRFGFFGFGGKAS